MGFQECCKEDIDLKERAKVFRESLLKKKEAAIRDLKKRLDAAMQEARDSVKQGVEADTDEAKQDAVENAKKVQKLGKRYGERVRDKEEFLKKQDDLIRRLSEAVDNCKKNFENMTLCSRTNLQCCPDGSPLIAEQEALDALFLLSDPPSVGEEEEDVGPGQTSFTADLGYISVVPEEQQPISGLDAEVGSQTDLNQSNTPNNSSTSGSFIRLPLDSVFVRPSINSNFGPISGPQNNIHQGQFIGATVFNGKPISLGAPNTNPGLGQAPEFGVSG